MTILETARLRGERPQAEDIEDFVCLLRNPRVAASLGGLRSRAQIRQVLERFIDAWKGEGYGPWVFRSVASGDFVGYGGLIETRAIALDGIELLYSLVPDYWGQGLATELSSACVARGFREEGLEQIISFTTEGNTASRRVMEKNGFRYETDFEYVGLPHVLYRLRTTDWVSQN